MGKYSGRINRLIAKTHTFISREDYCLMRDYFKAQYDDVEKPPDLEEKLIELRALQKSEQAGNDPDCAERIGELIKSSEAVRLQYLLPWATENCKKYVTGVWLPKYYTFSIPKIVKNAKAYFADKKQKDAGNNSSS
jgi:hypothetical protein